jgi:hypothetical protein
MKKTVKGNAKKLISAVRDQLGLVACKNRAAAPFQEKSVEMKCIEWFNTFEIGQAGQEHMPELLSKAAADIQSAAASLERLGEISILPTFIEVLAQAADLAGDEKKAGGLRKTRRVVTSQKLPKLLRKYAKAHFTLAGFYSLRPLKLRTVEDDIRRLPLLLHLAGSVLDQPNMANAARKFQLANSDHAKCSAKTLNRVWARQLAGELPHTVSFLNELINKKRFGID